MHADTISLSRGGLVLDPKQLLAAKASRSKNTERRFLISLVGEFEDPATASSSCLLESVTPYSSTSSTSCNIDKHNLNTQPGNPVIPVRVMHITIMHVFEVGKIQTQPNLIV